MRGTVMSLIGAASEREERTIMGRKLITSDQKPGRLPTIQSSGDSITYVLAIEDVPNGVHMKLRCDAHGNVFISTTPGIRVLDIN